MRYEIFAKDAHEMMILNKRVHKEIQIAFPNTSKSL